ncbi:hypothetical protein [Clostridium fallax]|uniref:Uncharacterized protein n=1 Tax=Clostridium fallax TaxID=1533 RepID=A0A1M4U457_9CLOT|nr:hypothetical protein [Clostridium fallax]SHE51416.1 hypothetical protein SAMN05443638_10423 [Clostridium fallax]SQB06066.1 Uncharacterised protein [Clostridium fallax]
MSHCPFWSTSKKIIECNDECPMINSSEEGEGCVFQMCSIEDNMDNYKGFHNSFKYDNDLEHDYFFKKFGISSNF